jgi:peptide/nickel transport system ATP-binding protein
MLTLPALRFGLARDAAEARALAEAALETVGLRPSETLGRFPHQLSGGQRQRAMVARAVMLRPRVLVADEPVSMVDASLRATILESLWRLRHDKGMSLVYVTHDLATAYQIADSIVVMRGGEIVEAGDAETTIRAPRHPYTRDLLAALPPADPTIGWRLDDDTAHPSAKEETA